MKKFCIGTICVTVCLAFTLNTFAESISSIKEKKESIDSERKNIVNKKIEEENKLKEYEQSLEALRKKNEELNKEVSKLNEKKKEKEKEIKTMDDGLIEAQKRHDEALELFKVRIRAIYMTEDDSLISVFLKSKDVVDFYERQEIMNSITRKNKEIFEAFIVAKKDLEYKKKELENGKYQIQKNISTSLRDIESVKTSRSEKADDYREVSENIKKLQAQEEELLEESKNLSDKIKKLQSLSAQYSGGKFIWTVPSCVKVSSFFGMRFHPVLKYNRMHTGIDVPAEYDASIVSAADGVIRSVGWEGGYGRTVIVDHGGGIMTLYAHTNTILVEEGQRVKGGQTIAKVGSTGLSTGPHLHFEVRKNGEPIDPMQYYKRN